MEHTIFHVDVNSAFLSWEAVYRMKHLGGRLDLRTVSSAVGGDVTRRHGIILAKSCQDMRDQDGRDCVFGFKKVSGAGIGSA